ncbi:Hypothetical_protein [Hexamita inflata]|uniref:Hypothetical_protein n=1 Tax=Hexamita inflata TaxID=28002 RepID=A0AA86PPX9_9EUKA|nr:Hypothetical protein HINF_LOCUS31654 [Hexamita inflata]
MHEQVVEQTKISSINSKYSHAQHNTSLYKHHFYDAFFVFTTYMTWFLLKYWSLPVAGIYFGFKCNNQEADRLNVRKNSIMLGSHTLTYLYYRLPSIQNTERLLE